LPIANFQLPIEMMLMISEGEARAKILEAVRPLPPRKMPVLQAQNRFAAEDYFARLPLPAFDNSAMDGYAVVAGNCDKGARLRVVGEQPAGVDRKLRVSNGDTVRIFTGAPVPAGADAVVMQEDVTREGDPPSPGYGAAGEIIVNVDVAPGDFVRQRGSDLGEGQKILSAGDRITAVISALLASQGIGEVAVGGEVRAAIISTGDELARPGTRLQPGQIYDSNSILLQGLVDRAGAEIGSTEQCSDNPDALRKAFQTAAKNDIVVVTGGVSVGEPDLVQQTLRELGAEIEIWRVAIKPGKPFLFGKLKRQPSPQFSPSGSPARTETAGEGKTLGPNNSLIFGLPGNPVSAFVTFLQFVRPAILKMMGATDLDLQKVSARLSVDLKNDSDRAHYFRGKFERGSFTPVGRQESHALFGLSQSNALLRLGSGENRKSDDLVEVELW
jgi:molybdopterin molybdotransferase